MLYSQINCPACGAVLDVPADSAGRRARCGSCQHRFQIPDAPKLSDDEIASLLATTEDEVDLDQHAHVDETLSSSRTGTILATEAVDGAALMRLAKLEGPSAIFEFPADLLKETPFRCAMPRTCMRCGARAHLQPHVIPFASSVTDSQTIRTLQTSGVLICCDPDVERLAGEALLARLPRVPNAPDAAAEPMPFWMCDMCHPEGLVDGRIIEDAKTGQVTCRLRIADVHRAKYFLEAVGGNHLDLQRLERRCSEEKDNPWQLVPETIRQRLQQWYQPKPGEHFLGYIPDRALSHTEDGRAGLIIS
ncbi:MAG: zinc ribbon domain-containing protein, partial [Planctomycetota bacterium]